MDFTAIFRKKHYIPHHLVLKAPKPSHNPQVSNNNTDADCVECIIFYLSHTFQIFFQLTLVHHISFCETKVMHKIILLIYEIIKFYVLKKAICKQHILGRWKWVYIDLQK